MTANFTQRAQGTLHERSVRSSLVIGLLLVLGLYFPTDVAQHLTLLAVLMYLVSAVLLACLVLGRPHPPGVIACLTLLAITPLLLLFTFVSGLPTLRFGALPGYALVSVLYLSDLREIRLAPWLIRLWIIVNILNVGIGLGIILGSQVVDDFIISNYSANYRELVPNMLMWHKPVLTFGTHSLAAFFLYLLFWIHLQTYKAQRKRWALLLAIAYMVLIPFLLSVSALAFTAVSLTQFAFTIWTSSRHKLFWGLAVASMLLAIAFPLASLVSQIGAVETVQGILQDRGNGFTGRFLPGGTMYDDLEYLRDHPFAPVGASFKSELMVGDGGPVEYMLRGSLPLLLLMYGGLFYFLRRNLVSRAHANVLFIAIVVFETGLTTLVYPRTLLLLPSFVVYLNNLTGAKKRLGDEPAVQVVHG